MSSAYNAFASYFAPPFWIPYINTAGTVNNDAGFMIPLKVTLIHGCTTSGDGLDLEGRGRVNLVYPSWYGVGNFDEDKTTQEIVKYVNDKGDWSIASIAPSPSGEYEITWRPIGNVQLGSLTDDKHWIASQDFTGDGLTDIFLYYKYDGNFWLLSPNTLNDNIPYFGVGNLYTLFHTYRERLNLFRINNFVTTDDFNGDGREEILHGWVTKSDCYTGKEPWSILTSDPNRSNQLNRFEYDDTFRTFGSLFDDRHALKTGDFTGDGRADILFHYADDGKWWLGTLRDEEIYWDITWSEVADTRDIDAQYGLGDLLDNRHIILTGNFDGEGRPLDIIVYDPAIGSWDLGTFGANNVISWQRIGNAQFGNLADYKHWITTGDYDHDGHKTDILFHYPKDGNWWFLTLDANKKLSYNVAANTLGFGNLLDGHHQIWSGNFDGKGEEILFHFEFNGEWWLGTVSNDRELTWQKVAEAS